MVNSLSTLKSVYRRLALPAVRRRWQNALMLVVVAAAATGCIAPQGAAGLGKLFPRSVSAERPILHIAMEGAKGEEQPVLAATLVNGKQVGTFPAIGAAWSPKGDEFALFISKDSTGSLATMNLNGDERVVFTPADGEELSGLQAVWSPDGKQMAVITRIPGATMGDSRFFVVVVDAATGKVAMKHAIPDGTLAIPISMSPADKFRWSPDGKKILISWENAVVLDLENERIIPISDQHVVAEWAADSAGVYYLPIANWDSPGDRALGGFYLRKLDEATAAEVMDGKTLAAQGIKMPPGLNYGLLTLSPSGDHLAFVGGEEKEKFSQIRIYDLKAGQPLAVDQPARTFETERAIAAFEWSPDEANAAMLTLDVTGTVGIDTVDMATGKWSSLAALPVDVWSKWTDGIDWLGWTKLLSWTQ